MSSPNETDRILAEIRDIQQEMVGRQRRWSKVGKCLLGIAALFVVFGIVLSLIWFTWH